MQSALWGLWTEPAVRWLAVSRLIAVAGAPMTMWLVLSQLSPATRGLWILSVNVLALGPFVELGPGTILVQFFAHSTPDGRAALKMMAEAWYGRSAIVVGIVASLLGVAILMESGAGADSNQPLRLSWLTLVFSVVWYIRVVPTICALEADLTSLSVQRMRAVQAIAVLATLWGGLLAGIGILSVTVAGFAQVGVARLMMRVTARSEAPELDHPPITTFSEADRLGSEYRQEQWRSAGVWTLLWVTPQVMTPALLVAGHTVAAGKLGVSMALALAPASIAVAWLQGRFASMGRQVAARQLSEFDRSARTAFAHAAVVQILCSLALLGVVGIVVRVVPRLAGSFLTLHSIMLLLIGNTALLVMQAVLGWGRAFRDERLAIPVTICCIFMSISAVVGAGYARERGATVAYAMSGVASIVGILPTFAAFRRQRLRA